MKRPSDDDGWWDPGNDGWLYSGYWDICILFHAGSKHFWR